MGKQARPRLRLLGAKLRLIRITLDLSQPQMFKKLRPKANPNNHSIISEYERGLREPNLTELWQYCRISGVSPARLLDDDYEVSALYDNYF